MARSLRTPTVLVLLALAALPRCGGCDSPPSDAVQDCATAQVVPGAVATDILFVIDDSQSMGEEQAILQAGLSGFIQTLAASPVANDFQIGVTTTSVAAYAGTAVPPQGSLVGPILQGGSPSLVADFERQVIVGTSGSSREQPFAAARLALEKSEPGGPNEGFLRPGARLAIIFLSDEDDCSGPYDLSIGSNQACRTAKADPASTLVKIGDFAAYLNGPIDGAQREVVVAAIAGVAPGTLAPSCGETYCADKGCGTAFDQGDRFIALLDALGASRTRLASICDASFDRALSDFAGVIMSQTLPLEGTPADWRLLAASVERPSVGTIPCTIAPATADAQTRNQAGAIYEDPQQGRPASLTFQNDCTLQQGDRVNVQVVCIR